MDRKKIFLITAIIILIILGIIFYFALTKKDGSNIPIISNLFPETGNIKKENGEDGLDKETNTINIEGGKEQEITKISDKSVVGAVYDQKINKIKYADKANGHIYVTESDGKNTERISNTTILNVFNVAWSFDKNKAILQFLKEGEINNFSASFTSSSTEGLFLSKNIKSLAPSLTENKLAYIEDINGRGVVFISDFENKNKQQTTSLPISDFNLDWKNKDSLSLVSKPAFSVLGYLYSLNLKDKTVQKLIEEESLNALWSKDGKNIYITKNTESGIENKVIESQTKKEYPLSVKTFVEKCAWSALQKEIIFCAAPLNFAYEKYPDDWYKGKKVFNDALYKINYTTGANEILLEKEMKNRDFDMTNLFFSPEEKYLFFINKKDSSLWSVKLKN